MCIALLHKQAAYLMWESAIPSMMALLSIFHNEVAYSLIMMTLHRIFNIEFAQTEKLVTIYTEFTKRNKKTITRDSKYKNNGI